MRFAQSILLTQHPLTELRQERERSMSHKCLAEQARSEICQQRFAANRRRRLALKLDREYRFWAKKQATVQRRSSQEYIAHELIRRARNRSLCTLVVADLLPLPAVCPCCGVAMTFRSGQPGRLAPRTAYSLDKRDPDEAYVPGNTSVICFGCNMIKRDYTAEQLETVAAWMRRSTEIFAIPE